MRTEIDRSIRSRVWVNQAPSKASPDVGIDDWYNGVEQHWKLALAAPLYPEHAVDRQRCTP